MLRIKRTGGNVFYLKAVLETGGPRTISNGKARRDSAGQIDCDKQWSRVQFNYKLYIDRETKDHLWELYKDSDPILTPSGATNLFQFHDDDKLTSWVSCTKNDIEHVITNRLKGDEEGYYIELTLECSSSDYDTYRRTA